VTLASANACQVVVALTGGDLVHFELNETRRVLVSDPIITLSELICTLEGR
jgi:hypothetical protein